MIEAVIDRNLGNDEYDQIVTEQLKRNKIKASIPPTKGRERT